MIKKSNKRTKRTKRTKKGGNLSDLFNYDKYGNFVPDNLRYRVNQGLKTELLDKYRQNKEDAIIDYNYQLHMKEQKDKNDLAKAKELHDINKQKQDNRRKYFLGIFQTIPDYLKVIGDVFSGIKDILGSSLGKFVDVLKEIFKSNSVTLRFIYFVLSVLIILGISMIFSDMNTKSNVDSYKKDVMNNKNNDLLTIKPPDLSIGTKISTSLNNLIPEKYRYNITSTINKVNLLFGNDTISKGIDTYKREEIKDGKGRYDNIYHINTNPNNNEKVYSLLKPNDINLNFDMENINNADYYKLPENLRKIYDNNYKLKLTPEINQNSGIYEYKMSKAYYTTENDKTEREVSKLKNIELPYDDDNISNRYVMKSIKYPFHNFTNENRQDIKKMNNFDTGTNKYTYPTETYLNKLKIL